MFFPYGNYHANNGFSVCIGTDKIQRKDVKFLGILLWKEHIKHSKYIYHTLYPAYCKTNYILQPFEDIIQYLSSISYTIRYHFMGIYLSITFKEN